ncbi:hypothetical protein H8E50_03195 [bacterium]|nr:hypothetical protein [bacterium]
MSEDIWVISGGRFVDLDLSVVCEEPVSGPVMEYKISELARYLLNPAPLTLEEKVIGCKVRYRNTMSWALKNIFSKFLPRKKKFEEDEIHLVDEIISSSKIGVPTFQDQGLNDHFKRISQMLRPYDPVQKKLASIDKSRIDEIMAMCEDVGGNRFQLNLQGNIEEKIRFVTSSVSKKVKVVLSRAYLSNGLFEMRGFDFALLKTNEGRKLLKFTRNGQTKYCVVNGNYDFEFWIDDHAMISYLHLFAQAVSSDSRLREALLLCAEDQARPLKLLFSNQLEQKYSETYVPQAYRELLKTYKISKNDRDAITEVLNSFQTVVSLNYVDESGTAKPKLFTNISVLHDIKALEPIKGRLPRLYSEIDKKAPVSSEGRLYLLDSMRGYQNA